MSRWVVVAFASAGICLGLGCAGETEKDKNPNPSLEYSREGPPKRGGIPNDPAAKKGEEKKEDKKEDKKKS